jgi:hypothetical protein
MSTITTLVGTDGITTANSMTKINANFDNLNTDKIETSYLDTDTTLAANSDTKIATQKAVKAYVDAGGNVNASTTTKGIVEMATASDIDTQTQTGSSGAQLAVNPATLQIYPVYFNLKALADDANQNRPWSSDNANIFASAPSGTVFHVVDYRNGYNAYRNVTSDWADADTILSVVVLGDYIYVLIKETSATPDDLRVYRYTKSAIGAGSQITFSGATLTSTNDNPMMSTDGTNIYINYEAGASASAHVISKFSVSETTFTFVSTITCGATSANLVRFHVRASDGNIIGASSADNLIRRYNTSGTLQSTSSYTIQYQYFVAMNAIAFYGGRYGTDTGITHYNRIIID